MTMHLKLIVCFAFLLSVAAQAEDFAPEEEFAEASTRLNLLTRSGKSKDACIKGGEVAVKSVIKEREASQKVLYKMPNGSKCKFEHSRNVKVARAKVKADELALRNAKVHLETNLKKKITVTLTYNKANGNCGTLFSTAVWKKHRSLIKKLKRIKRTAAAKLAGSKSSLQITLHEQRKAQCRCKRTVIKNADAAVTKARGLTAGRKKTIRRELLLICLAKHQGKKNGAGMSQCKGASLPSKYNAKLALHRTKLINWKKGFRCSHKFRGYGSRKTNDKCKGFFIPKSCNGELAFSLRNSNSWNRYQTFQCPIGWKWPTLQEYRDKVNSVRARRHRCTGYAYYNRCGWSGYPYPNKYYFRFSDSRSNCYYQHAGSYIGNPSSTCSTSYNAGLVCMKTY